MHKSHQYKTIDSHAMVEDENHETTHVVFNINGKEKNPGLLICKRAQLSRDASPEDELLFLGETFTLEGMQFYDDGEFVSSRKFLTLEHFDKTY